MATSADGRTFSPAVTVNTAAATGPRGWASIAIDATGAPHVVWLDARPDVPAAVPHGAAGHAAGAHVHGAAGADAAAAAATGMAMEQSLFHASAGAPEARVVRGTCFCCKTAVAAAPDALYLAWRHVYPTNLRDIAVARSTDGGRTFADPVRVSEDHWQIDGCPEDGPALAAAAGGIVHVAWPTFVEPAGRKAIFYSYSTDGGRTFAPRIRVDADDTRAVAHPQIAASGPRVLVTWDETDGTTTRIRTRAFTADASGRQWMPAAGAGVASDAAPAAYPAVAIAGDRAVVAWTTGADVRVRQWVSP
jgi:hypothetical protein